MNEKIFEALTALANKLGTTAEYLWSVLVQQARINAVLWLVPLSVTIVSFVIFFKTLSKMMGLVGSEYSDKNGYKSTMDWTDLPVVYWVNVILFGTIGVVTLCWALADAQPAIVGLLNPEYWALKRILSVL